jgi:protein transport protein SEC20
MLTMSNLHSLTTRLAALSESYKTTLQLINRLSKLQFQPGSTPLDTSEADVRVELTTDIHDSLKQQEEDLELLKQEIDDLGSGGDPHSYQRRRESERDRDRLRLSVQLARLGEDLRLYVFLVPPGLLPQRLTTAHQRPHPVPQSPTPRPPCL